MVLLSYGGTRCHLAPGLLFTPDQAAPVPLPGPYHANGRAIEYHSPWPQQSFPKTGSTDSAFPK